jgi:hypothetical protein
MVRRLAVLLLIAGVVVGCSGTRAKVPELAAALATPTATPVPTPAPTPTPTPTPEITGAPAPNLVAAPAGYQQIVSTESNYAIAIPTGWVYITSDGPTTPDDQATALKAQYPSMATMVSSQMGLFGASVKLVIFDPVGFKSGRVMIANLIAQAAAPSTDLKTLASMYASEIKSVYNVKTVTTKEITLPAGPTIQVNYSLTTAGVVMKLVQYIVLSPNHTWAITMGCISSSWATYQPIFAKVAGALQEF